MNLPLVSVVIPAYNCTTTIYETLNSIINQTYDNIEIIIVDDCSSDNLFDFLSFFDFKHVIYYYYKTSHKGTGPANARNIGISKSNGEYVAFLDSDDIWYKNKLSLQISRMLKDNSFFSFTSYDRFDANMSNLINTVRINEFSNLNNIIFDCYIGCLTVVCHKSLFNDHSFLSPPSVPFGKEDWVLWCQILNSIEHSKVSMISESCAGYRVLKGSLSSNKLNAIVNHVSVYKNHFMFGFFRTLIFTSLAIFYKIMKR